jgi:signal transduction histidine kinase
MSPWALDVATTQRIVGFVYLVMPFTVWFVLRGKHPKENLAAWCLGATAFGIGNAITSLRSAMPGDLATFSASLMIYASYPLRSGALRLEMGRRPRWKRMLIGVALAMAIFLAAWAVSFEARRLAHLALQLAGTAWLVWTAAEVWWVTRLPSARLIALAYGIFLIAALALVVQMLTEGGLMAPPTDSPLTVLTAACSLVAAMYASLGYVGLAIERAHRGEVARAQDLARESAQRLSAEQHAGQLRAWLDEREELLRLLAHEVRQPLNNAMAALHATHRALTAADIDSAAASQRVRRAESVLGQISGTLDNTLAATALLASPDRVEPRDGDIDTVTALSIGDLSPELRSRVQVQRVSQVRTATMDVGLMRLALRNLLINAGKYAPANTPVVLRVTDIDEPVGLVFAVVDQGPGIPPSVAANLFERGVRGHRDSAGHGLGLYVVRRVMELHGGTVDVTPNPGGGAIFRLTLPQTDSHLGSPARMEAREGMRRD